MKIAGPFIGILVVILLLGAALTGIQTARGTSYAQGFAGVATAGGVTTANVTLLKSLLDDDMVNVTSITSNATTESPVASTYTAGTKVLLVAGLDASTTRTLTVTYKYKGNSDAGDTFLTNLPLFLIIGLVVATIGSAWLGLRSKF